MNDVLFTTESLDADALSSYRAFCETMESALKGTTRRHHALARLVCALYLVALSANDSEQAERLPRWRAFIRTLAMFVSRLERLHIPLQRIIDENADLLREEPVRKLSAA
jgi:hypothetical protein